MNDDSAQYPENLQVPRLWQHNIKNYSQRLESANEDLFCKNTDFDLHVRRIRSDAVNSAEETFRTTRSVEEALSVSVPFAIARLRIRLMD